MQVLHLESSNAAMAEDLLNKTAIIQHYTMETKSGNGSVACFAFCLLLLSSFFSKEEENVCKQQGLLHGFSFFLGLQNQCGLSWHISHVDEYASL